MSGTKSTRDRDEWAGYAVDANHQEATCYTDGG